MIIDKTKGHIRDFSTDNKRLEEIRVTHEDMARPHQKLTAEDGEIFAVSLPRGEYLFPGAVLYADEERIVYVDLEPEEVLVIRPVGDTELARAAYNVGNMHQDAYIADEGILVAYDEIMEGIIKKLGIDCAKAQRKLNGIRAKVVYDGEHHHHE